MKNPFTPKTIELTDQERRDAVVNILTDSVILERVYHLMSALNNVGSINGKEPMTWNPCNQINGYANAFHLMGLTGSIEDEELADKLGDVIFTTYKDELSPGFKKDAPVVAELIYTEWLDIVIKYNREKFIENAEIEKASTF